MPRFRTLLLTLLLAFLAILVVVLFLKKSKTIRDAQSYAEQNPHCNEVKIHSNKGEMLECFLNFESYGDLPVNPQGVDTNYIPMAKFIGERHPDEFPLRIRHVFSFPEKTNDTIEISGKNINVTKNTNSTWRNKKSGCKFPGLCPVMPLKGSAIPRKFAKEDYNTERIFRNKFSAAGKSPVNVILPGKVLSIEQDSFFSVTVYHGENIYTTTSRLKHLSDHAQVGNTVYPDSVLGFLQPLDTTYIFMEIIRNGKYELWDEFYKESRE